MIQLFKSARVSKSKMFFLVLFIALQTVGTLYLPRLTARIINNGVALGDQDYVLWVGLLMLGVAVLTGIAAILATYFLTDISTGFSRVTRKRLFQHAQALSYQDFRHFHISSLITRVTNDIEQLQMTLGLFFQMLLPAPFVITIGLVLTFRSDPVIALIILSGALILVVVFGFMAKVIGPLFAKVQVGLDKINEKAGQYLAGIRVIRAFNRTKLEMEGMDKAFEDYAKLNIRINKIYAFLMPIVLVGMNLAIVAILWFGGLQINRGNLQVGDMMAAIEYSMIIMANVVMAIMAFIFIPRAIVCAKRINEVLQYQAEISDGQKQLNCKGKLRIEFQNVDFRYKDGENPVLHKLNFVCDEGTTTAIIGGTGSGKSTIARLIPRLLDVSRGQILLNGTNIKQVSQEELRHKVGFVPQKAFLFSGTIADNLRHGKPNATLQDMQQGVKIAQAEEFINEMDDKFEFIVAQGGRNLSGGQRQRLAIARTLMKKPAVYVFDDSFSALDFKTDSALRRALQGVTKTSIVIIVAQRITSIKDADQILVLDEGHIVGRGTHKELLSNCEVYLEIAKSQLSEEELANEC